MEINLIELTRNVVKLKEATSLPVSKCKALLQKHSNNYDSALAEAQRDEIEQGVKIINVWGGPILWKDNPFCLI
jgi:hypothetical protein